MDKQPYDAGDEAKVQKRKTKAQLAREKELEDFKQILATKAGRAFLWRLLEWCGVYHTSFTGNSTTFFNEGKRDIGLKLIEEIFSADPKAYGLLREEAVYKDNGD